MVTAYAVVIGIMAWGSIGMGSRASDQIAEKDKLETTPGKAEAIEPKDKAGQALEVQETEYPDGKPQSRIEGKKNEKGEFIRHGVATVWYENGQKKSEQHFSDGVPHGPRLTWYMEGRKWTEGGFVHGLEDGTWRVWLSDGTPQTEWTMRRGAWHGVYTEWHPNGKKKMEVEFVEGLRQGPMTVWDDQGVVILTSDFVDGVEQP